MAPPSKSRKGKKAWRKNIDASEVEQFIEETTHQERRGPAVESLQDSDLFFVDKSADAEEAQAVTEGVKRKRKYQAKPLRSEVIINAAHTAKPVVAPSQKRKVGALPDKRNKSTDIQAKRPKLAGNHELDIWGDDPTPLAEKQRLELIAVSHKKPLTKKPPSLKAPVNKVKPVEVSAPGSSYHPDAEQHQDAVAQLVATEMKKILKKELEPKAPPPLATDMLQALDEIDRLQVELSDDEEAATTIDPAEIDISGTSKYAYEVKTRKEVNKEKRKREADKQMDAKKKLKKQRHDIDHLRLLEEEVKAKEAEVELRRQRKETIKEEKSQTLPPRLGKHKFEPASVQVLTTDEIDGSLRRLLPCPILATDRFKSLQQRGLVEPRKRASHRMGRRVVFEKGTRTEKAIEGQKEIDEIQKKQKLARKEAKKAAKKQQL